MFNKLRQQSVIFILFLSFYLTLGSQTRSVKSAGDKAPAEKRMIERQLFYAASAEQRGDLATAHKVYYQLAKRDDKDIRVLYRYIDLSVRLEKIKECEVTLKDLAKKYPVGTSYIDPEDETASFNLRLLGCLSELYFRSGREPLGYEVHLLIGSANTKKYFKDEIKAFSFMRSGNFPRAEHIFREIRKELKHDLIYSAEMYAMFFSAGKIGLSAEELIKSAVSSKKKNKFGDDPTGFDPRSELFRIFEIEEYRDSILSAAENSFSRGNEKAGLILSELYFNSGNYDKAYEILKKTSGEADGHLLTAEFAIKLYNETQFEKASYFFRLIFADKNKNEDEDLTNMYISSLENSAQINEAVKAIKESRVKNRELMLARIYHNRMGMFDEAEKLYKENLTKSKALYSYWRDYLLMKLARKKFVEASDIIKTVLENNIMDVFLPDPFYEMKFYEALSRLLIGKTDEFGKLSDILIRDDFASDHDNDLIKIRKDLAVIGDDESLLKKYLEVLIHILNKSVPIGQIDLPYENYEKGDKKDLIIETAFQYYDLKGEIKQLIKLSEYVLSQGEITDRFARLITGYLKKSGSEPAVRDLLKSVLKSGISDDIKAEIREIIREREET